jgi:hypothetical protein
MTKFWILREPDGDDAERREAKWDHTDLRYEQIRCPIDPDGHRRAGARISQLSIILPNVEPYDFVWSAWECLVQEPVVQYFHDAGFTGYEAVPAKTRFAKSSKQAPKFWELLARGSAGLISPESGYNVLKVCSGCGLIEYDTNISDPAKVVDEAKWDGTDFFCVEPVSEWIFVTDRVVQVLSRSRFKGWGAYSLGEMKESFDIAVPGRSPM